MKKILFNDKFGLTRAVLEGRKTMTRRIVPEKMLEAYYDYDDYVLAVAPSDIPYSRDYEEEFFLRRSPYKVGEVVAVAQRYKDSGFPPSYIIDEFHPNIEYEAGWANKMFVKAELMPHLIRITNVRVEQLQDISDEDCLREGVRRWRDCPDCPEKSKVSDELYEIAGSWDGFSSPREAFATLIDKVSGKGTWEKNPYCFVYEFELVK